jgi:hypothetical protein
MDDEPTRAPPEEPAANDELDEDDKLELSVDNLVEQDADELTIFGWASMRRSRRAAHDAGVRRREACEHPVRRLWRFGRDPRVSRGDRRTWGRGQ